MKATGAPIARLQAALVAAYDYAGLRQMLRTQVEQDVELIAPVTAANLNDITDAVIRHYAVQPGGLHRLIRAARAGNPSNPTLAAVAAELLALDFEPDVATEADYRARVVTRYNRLGFAGLGEFDRRLSDIALEDVFVRLSLTVEKVAIKQTSPDEHKQTPPDEHEQTPSNQHDQESRWQVWRRRGKGRDRGGPKDKEESKRQREQIVIVQEPITLTTALAQNALIVGEPGAGKSTLLRWLAVTFAAGRQQEADRLGAQADADRLPLLVELGRLPERFLQAESRETPNWEKFLPEHIAAQPSFHAIPVPLLAAALAQGRGLLLCDGLDEIADLAARRRIVDSLAEYARSSANRLVLSSRPAGVNVSGVELRGSFQRITIQRFTPDDMQRFFRFWYALDTRLAPTEQTRQADALFAKVQAMPKTLELAGTPLLATLLLLIWRNEGDLPDRRVELYERCCRMLIEHWEAHHDVAYTGVLRDIGWERHLRLLAPLAYTIHNKEQRIDAPLAELAPILASALQAEGLAGANATLEAEKFLRALSLRSGLLQFLGSDRYGFPHLTFQEYLAARHIAAQPDPNYIDLVMEHLHEAWWREVHLLVIGHHGSTRGGAERMSRLLSTILNLYQPPWRILRPVSVSESGVEDLFSFILSKTRRYLIQKTRFQTCERISSMLAREFVFVTTSIASLASDELTAELGHLLIRNARRLIREIVNDPARAEIGEESPMELAAWTLGRFNAVTDSDIAILISALGSVNDVSRSAANSLGRLGLSPTELLSAGVRALSSSPWPIREQIAVYMREFGELPPFASTALVKLLEDTEWSVRCEAARSLRLSRHVPSDAVPKLLKLLSDPVDFVRGQAAYCLGCLEVIPPEVSHALLDAVNDPDKSVKSSVIWSLGKAHNQDPRIVATLVSAMNDPDSSVRCTAAFSLGELDENSHTVLAALVSGLHDVEAEVRRAASRSLGRLNEISCEAIEALVLALSDEEASVVQAATDSLLLLGASTKEVIPTLIEVLSDSSVGVRIAAANCLVGLCRTQTRLDSSLVYAADSPDPQVREAIAWILGKIETATATAVPMLMAFLKDADWRVRVAAVDSLGAIGKGSPEVALALKAAMDDADQLVCLAAAVTLAQLDDATQNELPGVSRVLEIVHELSEADSASTAPQLVAALNDPDAGVRLAAVYRILALGDSSPDIVKALMDAVTDPDERVREAAITGLGSLGAESIEVAHLLLRQLSTCPDDRIRSAVARSLWELDAASQEVVLGLLDIMVSTTGAVEQAAANSLLNLGETSPEIIDILVQVASMSSERSVERDSAWARAQPDQSPYSTGEVRRQAVDVLARLSAVTPKAGLALVILLRSDDSLVRYQAATSLGSLETASDETVDALVESLHDSEPIVQAAAAKSLGSLAINNANDFHRRFDALIACAQYNRYRVRQSALIALRGVLDGRPIPGYRWVPLRQRRERARRRRIAGYWVLGIATLLLLAWLATVVTTQVAVDPFVERFVTALLALVALAAGAVQVLAWFRRPFWDR
jgi:HEAT repeat protein